MELEHIQLLSKEVEKKFGRKILSSCDCYEIASEIANTLNINISFNTLRRFFGLIKTNHKPSLFTLNSLACFCGYTSFDNFITSEKKPSNSSIGGDESRLLNYLILLFKNTEVKSINDATYISIVQQTIGFISHHTYLIERFQKEIASTKNGQSFYYELFIHIDKLNSFYGQGLSYYLYEKKDNEAQIFANSLLCLNAWLTMNNNEVFYYYYKVMDVKINKSMGPSVHARYFAAQILFANICGLKADNIISEAKQFYLSLVPHKELYISFYCYEMVLAEVMILTAHYEEALFYINELSLNIERLHLSCSNIALLETILLFKAVIYLKFGNKSKSVEMAGYILPQKFHFLSKQYHTLLYILLKNAMKRYCIDQEQVTHLLRETGFIRLQHIWDIEDKHEAEKNKQMHFSSVDKKEQKFKIVTF